MVKVQELLFGHLQASQGSHPTGARLSLLIAHWEAFANRLLRNRARRHRFETVLIERRRRAIIMRENAAPAPPGYLPALVIGIECTRQEFQALFSL